MRAATWRTGNLERWESARRGVGRVDAGPPLPGVAPRRGHSGGGHSAPLGPAARVPRGERGSAFGTNERGVSAQSGLATGT